MKRTFHILQILLITLAPLTTLTLGACQGQGGESESPTETELPPLMGPPQAPIGAWYRPEPFERVRASALTHSHQVQRGFECGWQLGWQLQVAHARREGPPAFRRDATGRATTWALLALLLGLGGVVVAATLYPRLRRKKAAEAPPPDQARAAGGASWRRLAVQLTRGGLRRVARWMHLDRFDPDRGALWTECLEQAFETERHLGAAIGSGRALPGADSAPGEELLRELGAWRDTLRAWRRAHEAEAFPPEGLNPEVLAPKLALGARIARGAREAITACGARNERPEWRSWLADAMARPAPPSPPAQPEGPLPTWVPRAGWLGISAMALGLLFTSSWFAAGALPLGLALLTSLGGLGAMTAARLALRQRGGQKLLPGFADRAARWLTTLCLIATAIMTVSSAMSGESGLDLGDPPPVPMPDPTSLQAPDLFAGQPSPRARR